MINRSSNYSLLLYGIYEKFECRYELRKSPVLAILNEHHKCDWQEGLRSLLVVKVRGDRYGIVIVLKQKKFMYSTGFVFVHRYSVHF